MEEVIKTSKVSHAEMEQMLCKDFGKKLQPQVCSLDQGRANLSQLQAQEKLKNRLGYRHWLGKKRGKVYGIQ